MQIRDINTHKALPGIEVGDIGPKLGYDTKDNGFLKISNVSVPKNALLQRYITIDADGKVRKVGNPKIGYSSMMLVRQYMVLMNPKAAAMPITIALRYSHFRK